jgi:hypothetical protein
MISKTPVLGVAYPKNRRLAESNPKSRKRIPFALINVAPVRSFIIVARRNPYKHHPFADRGDCTFTCASIRSFFSTPSRMPGMLELGGI